MNSKKILVGMVVIMFIATMIPMTISQAEDLKTFKQRTYIENREVIPVYTENGIKHVPHPRGKPGVYVLIQEPSNGVTVSGIVPVIINSNENPTISIDGTTVGSGLSYTWDTTQYDDGSHTIQASSRGVTDIVTVHVDNGGGGNTAPTVIITDPNNGATVSGSITISIDATDPEDGSVNADIYIDGEFKATSNSYGWDTTAYSDASHTIYATTTDSGGLSASDQITVTVNNGGGGDIDKYALVIGISDYEGTMNDLTYCDDDAQDWKNFLQAEGYTVTMLLNTQATAENIETALYNLLASEDADDYVVLTYSGHGIKYRNYGSCIVSHDLYYMTHGYFESFFDMAESQHIYFAFDACQIGGFQGLVDTNSIGAFASNTKYSYDGDESMENGVFTYYQMEGWDSYNNFEDDAAYAVQGMQDWASQYIGLSVDPFYVDQFSGPMLP
jgi:hypothetical protein